MDVEWRLSVGLGFACALGCATAEEPGNTPSPTSAPPSMTSADEGTGNSGPLTTGIDPPDDDDGAADSTTSGGPSNETTGGVPSGESSSEGTGGESSDATGTGETTRCEPATTCNAAGSLGGVSGDSSTPPLSETGSEPIWVQVQVSENDSGVLANDLSVTVTLSSEGGDWDLAASVGAPGDTNGCGGDEQRSETSGVDSVSFSWGESGALANNNDDGTFVAIEVFPKAGVCTVGASWSLTVTGDT